MFSFSSLRKSKLFSTKFFFAKIPPPNVKSIPPGASLLKRACRPGRVRPETMAWWSKGWSGSAWSGSASSGWDSRAWQPPQPPPPQPPQRRAGYQPDPEPQPADMDGGLSPSWRRGGKKDEKKSVKLIGGISVGEGAWRLVQREQSPWDSCRFQR